MLQGALCGSLVHNREIRLLRRATCRYVLHMMRRGTKAELDVSLPAAKHLNLGLALAVAS